MASGSYRIDQPSVVSETIDGEVILLDLRAGLYFSIAGFGAAVWAAVEAGQPVEAIVAQAAADHPARAEEAGAAILAFVADLVARNLVVPAEAPAAAAPIVLGVPYAAPVLAVYEDMEDLLLLDPIHDVEEAGWPVRKPIEPAA